MHREIGSLLLILGLAASAISLYSLPTSSFSGNITSTSTVTLVSTTTLTQTLYTGSGPVVTTTITTTFTLTRNTQQTTITSNIGAAPVTIDGASAGSTPLTITLTYGTHTIGCGQVTGYNALNPTSQVSQDGTFSSFTCSYSPTTTPTTTLTVLARFCSLSTSSCYAVSGANIQLSNGATALTGSSGTVTFTVNQNTVYMATWLNSGYGSISGSVNVGTAPASITLSATTTGFSLVSWGDAPLVPGVSSGMILLLVGLSSTLMGAFVMAYGGKLEGEGESS